MGKTFERPVVTVSGKKSLFSSSLHGRIVQDLPQEGVEWRRRLDSKSKSVYVDVDFVDFDVDNVERTSERLKRISIAPASNQLAKPATREGETTVNGTDREHDNSQEHVDDGANIPMDANESRNVDLDEAPAPNLDRSMTLLSDTDSQHNDKTKPPNQNENYDQQQQRPTLEASQNDVSRAFFSQKLLGTPILHTYWADKADFDHDGQKGQFDEWIGQVQASSCTEWAIIIIEDGDFKTQFSTALFKSKLQSSSSQANASSASINSMSQGSSSTSASFLDRMKKGLSTMFQNDSNSDRWLTLINQNNRTNDNKAQESYTNFLRKLRHSIMASFSKQIELFEEQLRVQREMRTDRCWNFLAYFSMQEELAFAFEFLTLFDEALLQYNLLEALFSEYISSPEINKNDDNDLLHERLTTFSSWPALCLDMNCDHSVELRRRIIEREASLLDFRNYLFAKQCDLMLMQNQPWRVAASTTTFLNNCIREHESLGLKVPSGALTCWSFVSALEVLQKCECYSCTSTMENYSKHTIDIWNLARQKLVELGRILENKKHSIDELLAGLGPDPHESTTNQSSEISPQARLRDALAGPVQFAKHLVEITELTLGTLKHLGRKRHALLVGKELAKFYMDQGNVARAAPFLHDLEKVLQAENWTILLEDVRQSLRRCQSHNNNCEKV